MKLAVFCPLSLYPNHFKQTKNALFLFYSHNFYFNTLILLACFIGKSGVYGRLLPEPL